MGFNDSRYNDAHIFIWWHYLWTSFTPNEEREILFITSDLKQVSKNENKYCKVIAFYKEKLVELGVMKNMPNKCVTKEGKFIKKKVDAEVDAEVEE